MLPHTADTTGYNYCMHSETKGKEIGNVLFEFPKENHLQCYSAYHKTFDKGLPNFISNFRSSLRIWQFHYGVVNQIVNFKTKL